MKEIFTKKEQAFTLLILSISLALIIIVIYALNRRLVMLSESQFFYTALFCLSIMIQVYIVYKFYLIEKRIFSFHEIMPVFKMSPLWSGIFILILDLIVLFAILLDYYIQICFISMILPGLLNSHLSRQIYMNSQYLIFGNKLIERAQIKHISADIHHKIIVKLDRSYIFDCQNKSSKAFLLNLQNHN